MASIIGGWVRCQTVKVTARAVTEPVPQAEQGRGGMASTRSTVSRRAGGGEAGSRLNGATLCWASRAAGSVVLLRSPTVPLIEVAGPRWVDLRLAPGCWT
jgi:hypothetical protein